MMSSLDYRTYRGPVTTAIFDWAGTVIDFGCMAPVVAFMQTFARSGIKISEAEARLPMGLAKREHLARILEIEAVGERWNDRFGKPATDDDLGELYRVFLEIDRENAGVYAHPIPGALDTISGLRELGISIGSTTGYPREVMRTLQPEVAALGYKPDHLCTVSDVARGRPWPDMVLVNALALGAPDVRGCVVVDDSPSGLTSARAAGMWAVGVTASGNEVGLSLDDWTALTAAQRAELLIPAERNLRKAGAHYTIASVAELLPIIQGISKCLAEGHAP